MNKTLAIFGISADEVEHIPARNPFEGNTNLVTDEEITQISARYGEAIHERFREAANVFNMAMFLQKVNMPWRKLLDEFRDDLECTTRQETLIMPDGVEQVVVIDNGKFPGKKELREALWRLHEALDEIENYDPSKHLNDLVVSQRATDIRSEAKRPRETSYPHELIISTARDLGYWSEILEHGGKKKIREKIIIQCELRKHNHVTSIDSMHRAIERILESTEIKHDI